MPLESSVEWNLWMVENIDEEMAVRGTGPSLENTMQDDDIAFLLIDASFAHFLLIKEAGSDEVAP